MYKKQLMFFTSLLVLFSAFFFGCNQDKFEAGIGLVPDSLRLKSSAIDSFTVAAYTYKVDSVQTNYASKVLVGTYNDPILGEINASFVTELIPQDTVVSKLTTSSTVIDDLVLYLRYPLSGLRFYGDSIKSIRIDVMKINKYLSYSDAVYSNFEPHLLNASASPFAYFIFRPDTIIENADKEANDKWEIAKKEAYEKDSTADLSKIPKPDPVALVAIKLPDEWKNQIKDLIVNSINGTATFAQEFNGLYISASTVPTPYSISIFDYTDAETKVSLNYHYDSDTTDMGRSYDFNLSNANTHFNLFYHDHNKPGFLPDLSNPENKQDSVVYIQGAAGLRAKIKFPYLDDLIAQGIWAVNRAELIFTVENWTVTGYYPPPTNLILLGVDDNEFPLAEYYNQTTGIYTGAGYKDGQYKFDITSYMQKVFSGKYANNGLFLNISDQISNPSRVVLASGNHSENNKIKLKLTLTKLSN